MRRVKALPQTTRFSLLYPIRNMKEKVSEKNHNHRNERKSNHPTRTSVIPECNKNCINLYNNKSEGEITPTETYKTS